MAGLGRSEATAKRVSPTVEPWPRSGRGTRIC